MKNYKKHSWCGILVLVCTMFAGSLFAQKPSVKLPPFQIMEANGKIFRAENLPMGKPILLIYFSPDCDHCKSFTKDLLKQASKLKKTSIVLITYEDVEKVKSFSKEFNLLTYPNMYVGTEGNNFFVRDYYRVSSMPFVALHNKNGDMKQSYERDIPIKSLIAALEKLN